MKDLIGSFTHKEHEDSCLKRKTKELLCNLKAFHFGFLKYAGIPLHWKVAYVITFELYILQALKYNKAT